MADGRDQTPTYSIRGIFPWIEIFRCFQIALDPRKLFVAAAGILVMSFAWWLLSAMFWYKAPTRDESEYTTDIQKKYADKKKPDSNEPYTEEDIKRIGTEKFDADKEQWKVLDGLAGPGGRLRTLPWNEYRGPNPFVFATDVLNMPAWDSVKALTEYISGLVPVLIEPLYKLLLPVAKLISPGVSPQTRVYLFFILLCNIAIWAFCGGIITRLAAVQLANKGPMSIKQAVKFVTNRYLGYLGAPALPLGIIAGVVVLLALYGVVALIPLIGDLLLLGIGLPLVIMGGAVMAIFLVGLVGYPLMYTTLSAEGDQSDTFDALSRSLNYVYQCPWHYIWYWLVATVYGAAVTLFVVFFTSLTVYVGKWAVGLPAAAVPDRKPEFLFIYAPESFGWRDLLTKDSPYAVRETSDRTNPDTERPIWREYPVNKDVYDRARADFNFYNTWGAGLVCFWLTLIFLLMLGFTYSFFWSAATMIYFLMRKKVDESELDEVFIEDDEPVVPPAPPKLAEGTGLPTSSPTSLPVIASPPPLVSPPISPLPTVPPPLPPIPVVESPPVSPPATILFSPPPVVPDSAKPSGELKKDNLPPPMG
jgi:hypothetical protein